MGGKTGQAVLHAAVEYGMPAIKVFVGMVEHGQCIVEQGVVLWADWFPVRLACQGAAYQHAGTVADPLAHVVDAGLAAT